MPLPVIIDCDPGTDDAFALLLAFASPELDVRAVTVCGGNVPLRDTLRNALSLRALAGASVPVFAGADRPLLGTFTAETQVHGPDGLHGIPLPPAADLGPELAADAIRRILREAAEPITLVGIAPVTNFALAVATEPALRAKIAQIVLMSGAWAEGNISPSAEFNAFSDPEALQSSSTSAARLSSPLSNLPPKPSPRPSVWCGSAPPAPAPHSAYSAIFRIACRHPLGSAELAHRCTTPVPSPG
jgi:inosine-uridine nucleoside N-ribohydrolase